MENRLIKLAFLFLIFIILPSKALGYGANDVHPLLTEAAADIYNLKNPTHPLSPALIQFLKEGSRAEDEGVRWLFHAYDPIYNRGWFKDLGGLKIGSTSKDWSQNSLAQRKYGSHFLSTYPNQWLAYLFNPQEEFSNDQTFQKAIKEYLDGNKKSAFYALGHILHLIQDASVPDHTRQNPHIGFIPEMVSHYEEYTSAFCSNHWDDFWNKNKNQITEFSFKNLGAAFDAMANYSNRNFYSEDTIGLSEYQWPQPAFSEINGYLMAEDENKNLYHLAKRTNLFFRVLSGPNQYSLADPLVMADYFNHLIPKAISTSAGVIDLFFKTIEIEEAKMGAASSQSQNLSASLKNITTNSNNKSSKDYIIISDDSTQTNKTNNLTKTSTPSKSNNLSASTSNVQNPTSNQLSVKKNTTTASNNTTASDSSQNKTSASQSKTDSSQNKTDSAAKNNQEAIRFCDFNSPLSAEAPIIINEVNWMGSFNSSADEWIELKNTAQTAIDISFWQLINKSGSINISFPPKSIIPANGYYLLERTDDNSAPNVPADLIYTGGLRNTNEGLRLFNQNCQKIDEVLAEPDWPAGDNSKKLTMERDDDYTGWHTASAVNGTPKSLNSLPYTPPSYTPSNNYSASQNQNTNQSSNSNENSQNENSQNKNNNSLTLCSLPQELNPQLSPIIINELAWMGSLNSPNDEWIELKNLSDKEINISHWQLFNKSQQIKIIFGQESNDEIIVPANGFYLLERTDDNSVPNVPADLIYTGALKNNDEGLFLFDKNCQLIDFVLADQGEEKNWPAGDNVSKRTMERSNDLSWHTYTGEKINGLLGTPRAENSQPEKAKLQSYIQNFSWHPDLEGNNEVVLEFETNGYPFIESLPDYAGFWTMMVFYLNQEVPDDGYLLSWQMPQNSENKGLMVEYPACRGGYVRRSAIIFPVDKDDAQPPWCSSWPGGVRSEAFRRDLVPSNNHYSFKAPALVDSSGQTDINGYSFTEDDYLTIGFYAFDGSMNGGAMKLMLKDNNHYHYNNGLVVRRPLPPKNFTVQLKEDKKSLIFSWQELNSNIYGYRLKYHTPANNFYELLPNQINFSCEENNCQYQLAIKDIPAWPTLNPVTFYFDLWSINQNGFISEPASFELMVNP